jgi:PIN domain nuclease of toxin-antitoxin system
MAVLDTHILIWWFQERSRLSRKVLDLLESAEAEQPLRVSAITLWEVATLAALGKIRLDRPVRHWLEIATAPPKIRVEPITPAIAAAMTELPDSFHHDPADRIIVATAWVLGQPLVTVDRRIAALGVVPVID